MNVTGDEDVDVVLVLLATTLLVDEVIEDDVMMIMGMRIVCVSDLVECGGWRLKRW